ncbi:MAG: large repetitive protein, partial [Solirubrobacteraceae bacterium]|nr:large repetitive protein [Solirubrobacteraceae bacterium]
GACTTPHTTPTLGDGSHTFQARALDPAGNIDASPAGRTFSVDTTPPDTSITTGPAEGSVSAVTTPAFGFASTEAGSTFVCAVDTGAVAACASPLTTPALTDGPHVFAVKATDAVGNADQTAVLRNFTVLRPLTFSTGKAGKVRVSKSRGASLKEPTATCPAGTPACTVVLTASAKLSRSKKAKRVSIGSKTKQLAAGATGKLSFTLSSKAFKALKKLKRLSVSLTIVGTHGTLKVTKKASVTLLAPAKPKR